MRNVVLMSMRGGPGRLAAGAAGLVLVAALAACSGGGSGQAGSGGQASAPAGTAAAERPSSPAKLTIETPHNGQVVKGGSVQLRLGLRNAKIVAATTTSIRPDQGHVHVMLDGRLISMNYQLSQALPKLTPGTHVLQVEFVAADHLPFDPRVLTQAAFQVQQ
jgi:Family of unknown function (DUF6130)